MEKKRTPSGVQKRRAAARERYRKRKKSLKERTKCWCPKCERHHFRNLQWTGRGTPRIYCRDCSTLHDLSCEIIYPNPSLPRGNRTLSN